MLAPISWLKEYVDIDISPKELEEKLFSAGFEVEEVVELGKDISGVVVGLVEECSRIPDTHISVCKVNCGEKGTFQICCGADNVRVGKKFPAALVGATVYATAKDHVTIEGVMTIKAGKLRGEESCGMLCSGVELGLKEELYPGAGYMGLLELPDDAPLGADVKPIVGLDEVIFDIGITANRPDCQSILGMAREVAAVLKKPCRMPDLSYNENGETLNFTVTVEDPDLCPRYIAHAVNNVKIAPSPAWMQRRLALVGCSAISNVVDITNYVLKEFGQPMHAFDRRDLQDGAIVVRRAKEGEEITTLDEKTFALKPEHLVICDKSRPVALAGIMGGLNSEIKDSTTEILFEAAKFARDSIRKTGRALGQSSDSSARFEKGVDEFSTVMGMRRALHLMEELGAGDVTGYHVDVAVNPVIQGKPLVVSLKRIEEILGVSVPENEVLRHLEALNFEPDIRGDSLSVMVPPWREDIDNSAADIAEEIIRSWGYEHITPRFLDKAHVTSGGRTPEQKKALKLKNVLCRAGYSESIFYSFFSPKDLDLIRLPEDAPERRAIRLMNPLTEDLSLMRTTLTPSMINCAVRNLRRGNTEGRFFELARIFLPKALPLTEYPEERQTLCIGAFGEKETFFTAKAASEAVAKAFGLSFTYQKAQRPHLHPGMTAEILCGGKVVGVIGKLSYEICEELAIEKPVFLTEMDYEALAPMMDAKMRYQPISKFPAEVRDLALVADEGLTCGEITEAIASSCKYLTRVSLFDVYRSEAIGEGKKSMAFNLVFTPTDHEFTADEIEKYVQKILKKLSFLYQITLR
ncbi:MAG: phenylalanine--tRNA ligase subunit beta [Clostridia bacterium]|nr:phenylalanine--tRNA ligase subunit beta [Clostridia bacterium]